MGAPCLNPKEYTVTAKPFLSPPESKMERRRFLSSWGIMSVVSMT